MTSSIPETGGSNRSPLRDDYSNIARCVINRVEGDHFLKGDLSELLLDLYKPGYEWTSMLDFKLNVFRNDVLSHVDLSVEESCATINNISLVDFIFGYLESYGVKHSDNLKQKLKDLFTLEGMTKSEEFQKYVSLQRLIARVDNIRSHGKLKTYYECDNTMPGSVIRIFEDICIIDYGQFKATVMPYNGLLSLRDMMLKRSIARYVCSLRLEEYPSLSTYDNVVKWGEMVLEIQGNDGYSTISSYESLITGIIINEHDSFENSEFLQEIARPLLTTNRRLRDLTNELIESVRSESGARKVQCFSFFKLWSFPVVNEVEAMNALIEYGRGEKYIDPYVMQLLDALGRRQFFTQYVSVNNVLPRNCIYKGSQEDYLHRVVAGLEVFDFAYEGNDYMLLDWQKVSLRGSIDKIFNADIGSYMKDKSISPELDKLWQVYQVEYIPDEVMTNTGRAVRSGIIRFLKGDILSAAKLIDYVSEHGADEAWKVVGVTAKEKEHKPSARLFAMLVLHMKLWFAITESCLKEAIFKYFPQQSMDQTSSQSTLKKSMMSSILSSRYLKLVMNVDFSKWNTTFRYENTYIVFLFIDELFDFVNVYTYTHQFFQSCRVYISSRFVIPESLKCSPSFQASIDPRTNCNLWFYGFDGGFEGQRQKGWTLVTLLFMMYVIELKCLIINYILYGQGDNQVIVFSIDKNELYGMDFAADAIPTDAETLREKQAEIKELISSIKQMLEEGSREIGLRIKTAETWFSHSFFQYSKDFYINGARMPLDLKQLLAISPHTKSIVPTQFDIFGVMTATVNACFDSSHNTVMTYLIGMYVSCLLSLIDDGTYDRNPCMKVMPYYREENLLTPHRLLLKNSPEILELMSKIPSSLGGASQMMITNLISKGQGDYIQGSVDSLIRSGCPVVNQYLATLPFHGMQMQEKTDTSILLENPLAINLHILDNSKALLSNSVREYLAINAEGELRTSLEYNRSKDHKTFSKSLVNKDVLNPRLSSALYNLSVFAPMTEQIARIDGATLNRMAGVNLHKLMLQTDLSNAAQIKFLQKRRQHKSEAVVKNSIAFVKDLRLFWFGEHITVPIGTFLPRLNIVKGSLAYGIEEAPQFILYYKKPNSWCGVNTTRGPGAHPVKTHNNPALLTTGIEIPRGTVKKGIEELCTLIPNVCNEGSDLYKKIVAQVSTVTNFPIESVIDWTSRSSMGLLETTTAPSSSNFYTMCTFALSDELRRLVDDEKFELTKAKNLAVSLAMIQETLDMMDNTSSNHDITTYFVKYKKRRTPPMPTGTFDFEPSLTSHMKDSETCYVRRQDGMSYKRNISRKTDEILSITMIIDAALAEEGLLNLTGVLKRQCSAQILNYNARFAIIIFCIRFLISIDKSTRLTEDEFHGLLQDHSKEVRNILGVFTSDYGLQSLERVGLWAPVKKTKKDDLINATVLSCYCDLKTLFINDQKSFVRLTVVYESNIHQYESMLAKTMGYLSRCKGCLPTLESITDNYGSVMINYGKKNRLTVTPLPLQKMAGYYPLTLVKVENPTSIHKEIEGNNASWNGTTLSKIITIYTSLQSLVSANLAKMVVFHRSPTSLRNSTQESLAIEGAIRMMKNKGFHDVNNCTVIYDVSDFNSVYGPLKLEITNLMLQGADVLLLSSITGIKEVCHVKNSYIETPHTLEQLVIAETGESNIPSLFASCCMCSIQIDDDYFEYFPSKFNIRMYFPDWILRMIVMEDMRSLTDKKYTGRVNSSEIRDYLLSKGVRAMTAGAIEEVYGVNECIYRVVLAVDNISKLRLVLIEQRTGIALNTLESWGDYMYNDDPPFTVTISEYINCNS